MCSVSSSRGNKGRLYSPVQFNGLFNKTITPITRSTKHREGINPNENALFQKCSWGFFRGGGTDFGVFGAPHAPTRGRAGLENDTLLPMTMTCDWFKFWSGPAWRSKVIIRKPWRRKKKKKEEKINKKNKKIKIIILTKP